MVLSLGSWRLMFLLVLPIALVIAWSGLRRLENVGETQPGTVDWFSVVAAALGFGGLVYGLSGFGHGAGLRPVVIIVAGALAIATFVGRQLWLQRDGTPLMDLRALKHRTFTLSLALMSLAFMAMMGSMILLPLYLQNLRDLSPLQTGLLVMPGGLAMGLLGPSVGKVFDRFGGRGLVIPGALGLVVALAALTQVSLTMPFWHLLAAHVLLMVSLAALFTPVFTLGLGALPMHLYSHGSSMLGTLQQVAAAFGTALVVTIMSARAQSLLDAGQAAVEARLGGLRLAFLVGATLSVLVAILAVMLPGRLPAPAKAEGADEAAAPVH
jgi:DHA2 family lincomycin resistance protein-like MFS transporter